MFRASVIGNIIVIALASLAIWLFTLPNDRSYESTVLSGSEYVNFKVEPGALNIEFKRFVSQRKAKRVLSTLGESAENSFPSTSGNWGSLLYLYVSVPEGKEEEYIKSLKENPLVKDAYQSPAKLMM